MEYARVRVKTTARLVPLAAIEGVEVIAPVEHELIMIGVISENLHVVV